jgi:LmbE family N-acetylglucosaminyl deacetylase
MQKKDRSNFPLSGNSLENASGRGRRGLAKRKLNILVFGAHPDDCDLQFGGAAMKYRKLGHRVKFVSLTNGDTGHFSMGGGPLARRRFAEAQASAKIAGVEYDVLDIHNGELEPSVENRRTAIRIIREMNADLVLCHRSNDYHPDHRAAGVLVQDAGYSVTIPNVAPLTPHMSIPPVIGYLFDNFKIPQPFKATIAIDITDVVEKKIDMIACHESQVFEWLPYNSGVLKQVPRGGRERRKWLAERMYARFSRVADSCRETLGDCYGEKRGKEIRFAEAIMISEYGRPLRDGDRLLLFPFLK